MSEEPSCYRGRDRRAPPPRRHATHHLPRGAACRVVVVPRAAMPSSVPHPRHPPRRRARPGSNPDGHRRARWAGLPAYEGTTDSAGRPHGRGRLRLDEDSAWYEGRFSRGVRQGRGTLHFPVDVDGDSDADSDADPDASDPRFPSGGDRVTGTFADDTVEGWATYHCADGSSREGIWRDGELSGLVREAPLRPRRLRGAIRRRRARRRRIQHPGQASSRARSKTATSSPVAPCTPTRTRTASRRAAPSARRVFKPQRRHARPSTPWANPEPSSETSRRRRRSRPPSQRRVWGGATHERANAKEYESTRRRGRSEGQRVGRVVVRRLDEDDDDDGEEWVGPSRVCRLVAGRMLRAPLESATLASIRDESGDGDAIGEVRVRGDVIIPAGGSSRSSTGRDARWRRGLPLRRRLWDGARPTDGDVRARVRARVRRRRWAVGVPTVNARFIFARTTTIPRMNTTTRTVANRRSAWRRRRRYFLFDADPSSEESHRRTAGSAGIRARCARATRRRAVAKSFDTRSSARRGRSSRSVASAAARAVAQPPDYEGGWRVCRCPRLDTTATSRARPRRDSRTVGRRGRRRRARDGTRTVAGRVVG